MPVDGIARCAFPADFMFRVTEEEGELLRSQIVTYLKEWPGGGITKVCCAARSLGCPKAVPERCQSTQCVAGASPCEGNGTAPRSDLYHFID